MFDRVFPIQTYGGRGSLSGDGFGFGSGNGNGAEILIVPRSRKAAGQEAGSSTGDLVCPGVGDGYGDYFRYGYGNGIGSGDGNKTWL